MDSTRNNYQHNAAVVTYAVKALLDNRLVDPVRFLLDEEYAIEMIVTYIEAHNLAAEIMNDSRNKLIIYDVD